MDDLVETIRYLRIVKLMMELHHGSLKVVEFMIELHHRNFKVVNLI